MRVSKKDKEKILDGFEAIAKKIKTVTEHIGQAYKKVSDSFISEANYLLDKNERLQSKTTGFKKTLKLHVDNAAHCEENKAPFENIQTQGQAKINLWGLQTLLGFTSENSLPNGWLDLINEDLKQAEALCFENTKENSDNSFQENILLSYLAFIIPVPFALLLFEPKQETQNSSNKSFVSIEAFLGNKETQNTVMGELSIDNQLENTRTELFYKTGAFVIDPKTFEVNHVYGPLQSIDLEGLSSDQTFKLNINLSQKDLTALPSITGETESQIYYLYSQVTKANGQEPKPNDFEIFYDPSTKIFYLKNNTAAKNISLEIEGYVFSGSNANFMFQDLGIGYNETATKSPYNPTDFSPNVQRIFETARNLGDKKRWGALALTQKQQLTWASHQMKNLWARYVDSFTPELIKKANHLNQNFFSSFHSPDGINEANCYLANLELYAAGRAYGYNVRLATGYSGVINSDSAHACVDYFDLETQTTFYLDATPSESDLENQRLDPVERISNRDSLDEYVTMLLNNPEAAQKILDYLQLNKDLKNNPNNNQLREKMLMLADQLPPEFTTMRQSMGTKTKIIQKNNYELRFSEDVVISNNGQTFFPTEETHLEIFLVNGNSPILLSKAVVKPIEYDTDLVLDGLSNKWALGDLEEVDEFVSFQTNKSIQEITLDSIEPKLKRTIKPRFYKHIFQTTQTHNEWTDNNSKQTTKVISLDDFLKDKTEAEIDELLTQLEFIPAAVNTKTIGRPIWFNEKHGIYSYSWPKGFRWTDEASDIRHLTRSFIPQEDKNQFGIQSPVMTLIRDLYNQAKGQDIDVSDSVSKDWVKALYQRVLNTMPKFIIDESGDTEDYLALYYLILQAKKLGLDHANSSEQGYWVTVKKQVPGEKTDPLFIDGQWVDHKMKTKIVEEYRTQNVTPKDLEAYLFDAFSHFNSNHIFLRPMDKPIYNKLLENFTVYRAPHFD